MTAVTAGVALTGRISWLLSLLKQTGIFFSSTFTPSWTKPLNVNIAVALDGGVKDQSAIHKALYGVFVSNMYAIFVFILCYIPH